MVNCLVKKLKKLDSFGKSINFHIEGNENYKTIIGGLLNIFVAFIFFSHFAFSFDKFYNKKDPDISYSETANESRNITLSPKKFLFAISLFNFNNLEEIDISDYFEFILYYISNKKEEQKTFSFKPCNLSELNYTFDSGKLDKFSYCPHFEDKENITLSLRDNEEKFLYFQIYTDKTKPKKENIAEKIKDNLQLYVFKIKYNLNLFDSENYLNPIRNNLYSEEIILSKNKESWLYFKWEKLTVESVYLPLLDLKFSEESVAIRESLSDFRFVDEGTEKRCYLSALFFPNVIKKKYIREYPWIDELIGNSALISSCVSFFLSFFYSYYCDFKFKSYLFRKLAINNFDDINNDTKSKMENINFNSEIQINLSEISIKDIENNKKEEKFSTNKTDEKNQNRKKDQKKENLISEESNSNINPKEDMNNNSIFFQSEEKIKQNLFEIDKGKSLDDLDVKSAFDNFKSEKKKVSIFYLGYIFNIFSCGKKKNKYSAIDEFSNKFEEKFDIFFYFKRNKNISLIKKMILDKEQSKFIDLLSEKYLFKFKEENERVKKDLRKKDTSEFRSSLKKLDSQDEVNRKIIGKLFRNNNEN